ncbi:MAG: hypothetical protein CMO55_12300 [Verrucomicrobiales bacterium]|nr:hypothetical protein [Verrucomicrobiales bacterium]
MKCLPYLVRPVLSLATLTLLASLAKTHAAPEWQAIHHNISGATGTKVPGLSGVDFQLGETLNVFDRMHVAPGGPMIFTANTDDSGNPQTVVSEGKALLTEGDMLPFNSETVDIIDRTVRINDDGLVTIVVDTDGPIALDSYILTGSVASGLSKAIQEGDSIDPPFPGDIHKGFLRSPVITADGTIGYLAEVFDLPSDNDRVIMLGTTLIAQERVTVPGGQAGTETWEDFEIDDYHVSADGNHHILLGELTGAGSKFIVAVDGKIVLQDLTIIPGSGFGSPIASYTIGDVFMDAAGNWFARGSNDDNTDWIVRNGKVIAATGQPIVPGSSELWEDASFALGFRTMSGNSRGDYIYGGFTDNVALLEREVLIFSDKFGNAQEVLRAGDPIDLDGNGMFDDNTTVKSFNGPIGITDDRTIYAIVTVDNDGGPDGQAIITAQLDTKYGPDLTLGEKRPIREHKGNNRFGGALRIKTPRPKAKIFITVGNDGDTADGIYGSYRLNKQFKLKIKQLGAGNVTAQWKLGNHLQILQPNQLTIYKALLKRKGRDGKNKAVPKFRITSGNTGAPDLMKAKVKFE